MDSDSDHQYSYKRGSDPELNHPDFFEGNALVGPQLDVTGFLKFDPDHPGGMPASAASSVLYPVGYTPILCKKHHLDKNFCPECFEYPVGLKSTGNNCIDHYSDKKEGFLKKNSCRDCYDRAMAFRMSRGLPPIPWGIFCKHGVNKYACQEPECKESIRIYESQRRPSPPQQAVNSVFPDESDAQVFSDHEMGGGSKLYRKSARKFKKKTRSYRKAKRSSRKAKRSSRKAKRSSRSRR